VFALILVGFGLAVHLTFATMLYREMSARLEEIQRLGASEVDWTKRGFTVDVGDEMLRDLNQVTEGIQWYASSGKLVMSYGLAASDAAAAAMRSRTLMVHAPDDPYRYGTVRAVVSVMPLKRAMRRLDVGLFAGFALAMLGALGAGRLLTRQAMRKIEATMQTLAEFTADAAHELRGPLTAIATNATGNEERQDGVVLVPAERLRSIASATNQMARLTDDLLLLARATTSLERDVFVLDLAQRVSRVAELYRAEAQGRSLTFVVEAAPPARVFGNPDQIDRIVGNLIENAIRYTPAGGTVIVTCRADAAGSRLIVADSGVGIAMEHVDRVFERFWRADPTRSGDGGTGLGLAIAQALVRRHGGRIAVSSRLGVGSQFVVSFPRRPP
jgi:signal transduction histidine kinase